jgi:maltose alpha-D-glucosyltransferase/alpha-amylase
MLTLPAYAFYWFVLPEEADAPRWHEDLPESLPDFITLIARDGLKSLVDGQSARDFTQEVLPAFLAKQRWFAAKDAAISKVQIGAWAEFTAERDSHLLIEAEVQFAGGEAPQRYFMPLGTSFDEQALTFGWPLLSFSLAQVRRGAKVGALYDDMAAEDFPRAALTAMRAGREVAASSGTIRFSATSAFEAVEVPDDVEVRRVGVEQSNSSVLIGDQAILKAYRKLAYGVQPELEVGHFLTEKAGYTNTPPLLGTIEHVEPDGRTTALAAAFGFVRNQGDGWQYTTEYLHRELGRLRLTANTPDATVELEDDDPHGFYLTRAHVLGQRTAEMHRAFAITTEDPAFAAEPITARDLENWGKAVRKQAEAAFSALRHALRRLEQAPKAEAEALLHQRDACLERIKQLTERPVKASKTRLHGDYHLGQVLVAQNDFYVLDFEGEPARPLKERRAKSSPLKDVAGMLRSFDYAAWSAVLRQAEFDPNSMEVVQALAERWRQATEDAFLTSYRATIEGCISYPEDPDEARRLLEVFLLEKALYEICYEAANRPGWLSIPIKGVAGLLASEDQG